MVNKKGFTKLKFKPNEIFLPVPNLSFETPQKYEIEMCVIY